jgi:hypothetical protein
VYPLVSATMCTTALSIPADNKLPGAESFNLAEV